MPYGIVTVPAPRLGQLLSSIQQFLPVQLNSHPPAFSIPSQILSNPPCDLLQLLTFTLIILVLVPLLSTLAVLLLVLPC